MFHRSSALRCKHRPILSLLLACLSQVALHCGPPAQASAEANWIKLKSSHFELFTTATQLRGRALLVLLERVRESFRSLSPSKTAPGLPVRVIGFGSLSEFEPYRPVPDVSAYYVGTSRQDYVVIEAVDPETDDDAIHEYIHLLIRHAGHRLPRWLDEGLAELFSTLSPEGNKIRLGRVMAGRYLELKSKKWLSLETLINADERSKVYLEGESLFYAQGWALAHMLFLSREYRHGFQQFLSALSSGAETASAFRSVYDKTLDSVAKDLRRYLAAGSLPSKTFQIAWQEPGGAVVAESPSALEVELVLAELLGLTGKGAEAEATYRRLSQDYPDRPEIPEALAYLLLRQERNDPAQVLEYFRSAVELGSTTTQLFYDYEQLIRRIRPKSFDPHLLLGYHALNSGDFRRAVEQWSQVAAPASQSHHFLQSFSRALHGQGQPAKAIGYARRAVDSARTPGELAAAKAWLMVLEGSQAGPGAP